MYKLEIDQTGKETYLSLGHLVDEQDIVCKKSKLAIVTRDFIVKSFGIHSRKENRKIQIGLNTDNNKNEWQNGLRLYM